MLDSLESLDPYSLQARFLGHMKESGTRLQNIFLILGHLTNFLAYHYFYSLGDPMAVCLTYLQTSITTPIGGPITASYINLLIAGSSDQFVSSVYDCLSNPTMVQFESITKVHVPNSTTLFIYKYI
jgi:hypothetical protein